jgi:hypothetical protein
MIGEKWSHEAERYGPKMGAEDGSKIVGGQNGNMSSGGPVSSHAVRTRSAWAFDKLRTGRRSLTAAFNQPLIASHLLPPSPPSTFCPHFTATILLPPSSYPLADTHIRVFVPPDRANRVRGVYRSPSAFTSAFRFLCWLPAGVWPDPPVQWIDFPPMRWTGRPSRETNRAIPSWTPELQEVGPCPARQHSSSQTHSIISIGTGRMKVDRRG